MRIAVVIGASSGIGARTAEILGKRYGCRGNFADEEAALGKNVKKGEPYSEGSVDELWLVARRKDRLFETAAKIENEARKRNAADCESNFKCKTVCGDITDDAFCSRLALDIKESGAEIAWLINSAGCGFYGEFTDSTVDNNCVCAELNCVGAVRITGALLPFMSRNGRIVQLASAAAFFPQPGFAVYAASKAFVLSFSRALGRELALSARKNGLKKNRISVTAVCPGPCDTEFLTLANDANASRGMPSYKKHFIADCGYVAENIVKSAAKRKSLCLPTLQ